MDSRPPIVCHVTTVHPVPDPRIFLKQCRSLSEQGFTVYALFTGNGEGFDWKNIRPISIGPRSRNRIRRLLLFPAITRALRQLRPHIVHFHDPELLPLMCVLQMSILKHCRFVYDVHEDYKTLVSSYGFPWNSTGWLYNRLARYAEEHMTLVLAEDSYQHRFRRVHSVIHNFSTLTTQTVEQNRENTFIYVGGVSEHRGAFTMIEAFSQLRQPAWKLQIIGRASNDRLAAQLRQLAAQESLHPGQIELHDYMPFPQALEKIRKAKVGLCLLSPELNYVASLPTKVFDYLSVGTPALLSDFPYYRKFFATVSGIRFVDPRSPNAIAAALRELTKEDELPRLLAEAEKGRLECLHRFSWEAEADKLLALYSSLVEPVRRKESLRTDNVPALRGD